MSACARAGGMGHCAQYLECMLFDVQEPIEMNGGQLDNLENMTSFFATERLGARQSGDSRDERH
jgi:hypothetical protein